ncbi:MAG TPA: ABC transporter permease [Acidimicrobiales bacterium]|nr:ABC transporter permease [Acidimicrobiales bacterium]
MSLTLTPSVPSTRPRLRTTNLLRSEWTKMRSVRSTMWTLVAMIVVVLGISVIGCLAISNNWTTMSLGDRLTFDPTGFSLKGILFSQLIIGVLGVLIMSAEYGTGTIRATLTAIPNRPRVLVVKALVFAAVSLVVGEILSFGAFFVGQALLRSPAPHATLSQPEVLRAVVGGGLVIMVLGLFALGLATIIRHSAGAITSYVGAILVVPIIIETLPSSIGHSLMRFMPVQITNVMTATSPLDVSRTAFSPWVGFALLCGYAAIALVIAGVMMVRRDA